MYKASIWNFGDSSMRSTYESMISSRDADSLVMQAEDQFDNVLAEPMAKLISQSFAIAFSEELRLRGLIPGRTAMRTLTTTEELARDRHRIRVVLDVITEVSGSTQAALIDALAAAKRKCSAKIGSHVKIVLKAELKSEASQAEILVNSHSRSLSAAVG